MFEHVPPISEVDVLTSPDAVAAELARSLPRGEDVSALLMLDPEALSDAGGLICSSRSNGTSRCCRLPNNKSSPHWTGGPWIGPARS
jgi:hypothetical protein